jgi:RyR domain/TrkA-N domain
VAARTRSVPSPRREEGRAAQLARYALWVFTVVGLAALAAGFIWTEGTVYQRAMDALRLFTQGIPERPKDLDTPWQLMVARTVAPFVSLFVTLRIIYGLYSQQIARAWTRHSRNHTVVCGLGAKGRASATAFAKRGSRVVGVDVDPPADAASDRVRLVRGDAMQALTLQDAAITRASELVCACGPDDVNLAIATQAAALRARAGGRPMTALVHVADADLAEHVRASALALAPLRIQVFNVHEVLARRLLDAGPLARVGSDHATHIVIVGDGELARALVIGAARAWHFGAPADGRGDSLRLTVVGERASRLVEAILARYPALEPASRLVAVDSTPTHDGAQGLARVIDQEPPADVVYLAEADDSDDVRVAVALERRPVKSSAPVIVLQSAFNDAFLKLLPATWTGTSRLVVVPLGADVYGRDLLVSGVHEAIAHAIHTSYVRERQAAVARADRPALLAPWDDLTQDEKEANRAQADAIFAQLQAVWYRMTTLDDWAAQLEPFSAEEVELMAELEHARWMAEHRDAGWSYGSPRNNALRQHPDFVPWADLPEDRRAIDREFIRARPAILAEAGYRIIRDPARARAARAVHELYAAQATPSADSPLAALRWDELAEADRALSLAHVDDLPYKLHTIGLRLAVATPDAPPLVLSTEEIERLSEREHERWAAERERGGWRHGPLRDDEQRLHPALVAWSELSETVRDADRVLVRAIPELLAAAGLTALPIDAGAPRRGAAPSS